MSDLYDRYMTIATEAITEEVKSNGQWVHAVQNEISRAIVGQKYLIDRMLVGVFQRHPSISFFQHQAHRTARCPDDSGRTWSRQRTIKSPFWRSAKRLERGRFSWPIAEDQADRVSLSHEELSLLLGGIDLRGTRRKDWYRKTISESEKE